MKFNTVSELPETFCILPWIHSSINPGGEVRPCCQYGGHNENVGNLRQDTLKDIFHSEQYQVIRRQFLRGEWPEKCYKCYDSESAGVRSYRQSSLERFKDEVPLNDYREDGTADYKQVYIDYRFTNKCNHKCITCGPGFSSLHATEAKKQGSLFKNEYNRRLFKIEPGQDLDSVSPLLELDNDMMFEQFREILPTLKVIYFAGGEPLISDHHYDILNLFIESQQPINIFYNTNFSELNYKNQDVVSMWKKVNGTIELYCSLDGVREVGEAIRIGMVTESFAKNIQSVLKSGATNLKLSYNITYGTTNVYNLIETIEWLEEQHGPDHALSVNWNPIHEPRHFSLASVPMSMRDEVVAKVEEQIAEFERKNLNGRAQRHLPGLRRDVINWIKSAPEHTLNVREKSTARNMLNRTDFADPSRWQELLPLVAELIKEDKVKE